MNYKDTVLKSTELIIETPKLTNTDDGKCDIDIHIPLTVFLELQARRSFMAGINEVFEFVKENHSKPPNEFIELLKHKYDEWEGSNNKDDEK